MTGRAKEVPLVPIHIKCYTYTVVNGYMCGVLELAAWDNVRIVHRLFWNSPCFLVPFKAVPDGLF